MQDFKYVRAKEKSEVVSLLSQNGKSIYILSGGTDLLVQMREGQKQADLVVDIKDVPEANSMVFDPDQGLHLGAAVSCKRICADTAVAQTYLV